MSRPAKMQKSINYRLHELAEALSVIRDSLIGVQQGKTYQLIPIYGQLRALLYEKSAKQQPLLLSLSAELNRPLEIYYLPGLPIDELPERSKLKFFAMGAPFGAYQTLPARQKIKLAEFLDFKTIFFSERWFTVRDLITFLQIKQVVATMTLRCQQILRKCFRCGS